MRGYFQKKMRLPLQIALPFDSLPELTSTDLQVWMSQGSLIEQAVEVRECRGKVTNGGGTRDVLTNKN